VKESHAENRNHPAHNAHYDDAYNNRHLSPANGGQYLPTNDAINGRVSNHENNVEETKNLGWPVAHEESQHDL
jgi:hypothetical protein